PLDTRLYSLYGQRGSTASTHTIFFFNATTHPEIFTLSLHDALPIFACLRTAPTSISFSMSIRKILTFRSPRDSPATASSSAASSDRKSTRLNSSHVAISYAVFCLKKKNKNRPNYLTLFNHSCQQPNC